MFSYDQRASGVLTSIISKVEDSVWCRRHASILIIDMLLGFGNWIFSEGKTEIYDSLFDHTSGEGHLFKGVYQGCCCKISIPQDVKSILCSLIIDVILFQDDGRKIWLIWTIRPCLGFQAEARSGSELMSISCI